MDHKLAALADDALGGGEGHVGGRGGGEAVNVGDNLSRVLFDELLHGTAGEDITARGVDAQVDDGFVAVLGKGFSDRERRDAAEVIVADDCIVKPKGRFARGGGLGVEFSAAFVGGEQGKEAVTHWRTPGWWGWLIGCRLGQRFLPTRRRWAAGFLGGVPR